MAKSAIDVAAAPTDTSAYIQALQQVVQAPLSQHANANIVLSTHFVRYALVPWSAELATDDEKRVWIEHKFNELYGAAATPAEYRWSEESPDGLCVTSAVDAGFAARIREVLESASVPLVSMQPYLMTGFNRVRREIPQETTWLILPERGRICIASVSKGQWQTITSKACGDDCIAELPGILGRELVLAAETQPPLMLTYSPEVVAIPAEYGDFSLRVVATRPLQGYIPSEDTECAFALAGVV